MTSPHACMRLMPCLLASALLPYGARAQEQEQDAVHRLRGYSCRRQRRTIKARGALDLPYPPHPDHTLQKLVPRGADAYSDNVRLQCIVNGEPQPEDARVTFSVNPHGGETLLGLHTLHIDLNKLARSRLDLLCTPGTPRVQIVYKDEAEWEAEREAAGDRMLNEILGTLSRRPAKVSEEELAQLEREEQRRRKRQRQLRASMGECLETPKAGPAWWGWCCSRSAPPPRSGEHITTFRACRQRERCSRAHRAMYNTQRHRPFDIWGALQRLQI